MSKRCGSCGLLKPIEEFATNRTKSDGRQTVCRLCKKSYNATYYELTKGRHNPTRAARRRQVRGETTAKLIEYLRCHPCVDCGEDDIVVLDFDHLRDKVAGISNLVTAALHGNASSPRSRSVRWSVPTTTVGGPRDPSGGRDMPTVERR